MEQNGAFRLASSLSMHQSASSMKSRTSANAPWIVALFLIATCACLAPTPDFRGSQFLDFKDLSSFTRSAGENPGEWIYTSPELKTSIPWNELIVSWNLEPAKDSYLKVEARAISPERTTKYYTLGLWSPSPETHPLKSVANQKDADGNVLTDTLKLTHPSQIAQLRLTLGRTGPEKASLKLLTLIFTDTTARPEPLPPNRAGWKKLLEVPERSQMAYPDGKVLCSPTTVSMLMAYWAQRSHRP